MHDRPVLLVAAHGTKSAAGHATTLALVDAVAAQRPDVDVRLCFLDVRSPTLAESLDALTGRPVVVVPLLLAAGYHVTTDIPAVAVGHPSVRVAAHLGPDPLVIEALVARLSAAGGASAASIALVGVGSAQPAARADLEGAADALGLRLGRRVEALTTADDLDARLGALPGPVAVATYVLAEGDFVDRLRAGARGRWSVADPIGAHPSVATLVVSRYDAAC